MVSSGIPWEEELEYITACRTRRQPGEPDTYVPARKSGETPTNVTAFQIGSAHWNINNLPNICYDLYPTDEWEEFKKGPRPAEKLDSNGQPVFERGPWPGTAARVLLDFPILRNINTICTEVEWEWLEFMMRLDPRITWDDIDMRMDYVGSRAAYHETIDVNASDSVAQAAKAKRKFINAMQTRCQRGRLQFSMIAWRERAKNGASNKNRETALSRLSPEQIANNTTRGTTPGLIDPCLPDTPENRVPIAGRRKKQEAPQVATPLARSLQPAPAFLLPSQPQGSASTSSAAPSRKRKAPSPSELSRTTSSRVIDITREADNDAEHRSKRVRRASPAVDWMLRPNPDPPLAFDQFTGPQEEQYPTDEWSMPYGDGLHQILPGPSNGAPVAIGLTEADTLPELQQPGDLRACIGAQGKVSDSNSRKRGLSVAEDSWYQDGGIQSQGLPQAKKSRLNASIARNTTGPSEPSNWDGNSSLYDGRTHFEGFQNLFPGLEASTNEHNQGMWPLLEKTYIASGPFPYIDPTPLTETYPSPLAFPSLDEATANPYIYNWGGQAANADFAPQGWPAENQAVELPLGSNGDIIDPRDYLPFNGEPLPTLAELDSIWPLNLPAVEPLDAPFKYDNWSLAPEQVPGSQYCNLQVETAQSSHDPSPLDTFDWETLGEPSSSRTSAQPPSTARTPQVAQGGIVNEHPMPELGGQGEPITFDPDWGRGWEFFYFNDGLG